MFHKFTTDAIKVIMYAQEESRRLGHNFVGTEMILLGLLRDENTFAGQALERLGLTHEQARKDAEGLILRGSGHVDVEIPFTPSSKRLLQYSWEEAQELEHDYISTEHLLLGLLTECKPSDAASDLRVAAKILEYRNVNFDELRKTVLELVKNEKG